MYRVSKKLFPHQEDDLLQKKRTKIFADSGDPKEVKNIIHELGIALDGVTTNPSLVARSPAIRERIAKGEKFSKEEFLEVYRQEIILPISELVPRGSVSVEVYANNETCAQEMFEQGEEMFLWIPNAHIKFPTNWEGLRAGARAIDKGIRINMTLCFNQAQAAAVHFIAVEALRGEVFVSPFVGRLDDKGLNGMDLIQNIIRMYSEQSHLVDVLTASVRNLDHLLYAMHLESDIVTAPFRILEEWVCKGMPLPSEKYVYPKGNLKDIPYIPDLLAQAPEKHAVFHEMTIQGIVRFSADWDSLIQTR